MKKKIRTYLYRGEMVEWDEIGEIMDVVAIDWNGPIQLAIVACIILGDNIYFFILSRSDNAALRQETQSQIAAIQQEVKAIHAEIKDFHARLIAIEEKNRK